MLFSIPHIARVAFFLYFRKQMKAAPSKGKQMKGLWIWENRGSAGSCAPVTRSIRSALGCWTRSEELVGERVRATKQARLHLTQGDGGD